MDTVVRTSPPTPAPALTNTPASAANAAPAAAGNTTPSLGEAMRPGTAENPQVLNHEHEEGSTEATRKTFLKRWMPTFFDRKAPTDARNKPFPYARNTVIGATAGLTALGSAGTSIVSQIPLIGKIPYLPELAAGLHTGISKLITPLGLGTGPAGTNFITQALPAFVGPTATVALSIPTALFGIGLIKSLVTGDQTKRGYWGNVAEATKLIGQIPFMPYIFARRARGAIGTVAQKTWNNVIAPPVKAAWGLAKNIATSTWNATSSTVGAIAKPTWTGIGGLGIGTVLATMSSPMTGGASYFVLPPAGVFLGNYLSNKGHLSGSSKSASPATANGHP